MKKYTWFLTNFVIIVILSCITTLALPLGRIDSTFDEDKYSAELRPFDFSDKYYETNGVQAAFIINRRNGMDGFSVFDFINDPNFRSVRITATAPAYSAEGKLLYWNLYGDLFKESFTNDRIGEQALETAYYYPIFTFPSETVKNSDRQAVVMGTDEDYFEKNPLGLGVVVLVEYTSQILTKDGQQALQTLAKRNGISADGTPIIRTVKEIEDLSRQRLVTQKIRGFGQKGVPSFAIAKIIQNPELGAIAQDAFLMYVKKDGKPLPSEESFLNNFECLQKTGRFCSEK